MQLQIWWGSFHSWKGHISQLNLRLRLRLLMFLSSWPVWWKSNRCVCVGGAPSPHDVAETNRHRELIRVPGIQGTVVNHRHMRRCVSEKMLLWAPHLHRDAFTLLTLSLHQWAAFNSPEGRLWLCGYRLWNIKHNVAMVTVMFNLLTENCVYVFHDLIAEFM